MEDYQVAAIIVGSIIILGLIIYLLVNYFLYRHYKNDALLTISYRYPVYKRSGKIYYDTQTEKIEIIFIKVNKSNYLQFNSPTIYQIEGNGKTKLFNYNFSEGLFKLVLVIPGKQKVKKAINENEVEFVTPYTLFNNFRVVRYEELSKYLGGAL